MTAAGDLPGWTRSEFRADGYARAVYRAGSGPGVVVIHEIPGITPKVAELGRRVVDAGFTVAMPSLVGTPGRALSLGYGFESMVRACVAREFTNWAVAQTSPISVWLRSLA